MENKIKDALSHGFDAVPWVEIDGDFKPRKFKGRTYKAGHNAWKDYSHNLFSIHLNECVLVDIDGNKTDTPLSELVNDVCVTLGLDGFDLELAEFQRNDKGDSLHYLFKAPQGFDVSRYQQSNDGKLIKHVDFKTGNQLVHVKKNKTVSWVNRKDLPELTPVQFETLFGKEHDTSLDDDDLLAMVNAQPDTDLTDSDVKRTLDKIDVSVVDHDQWLRIGLGISHQYQNSEKGKQIFKNFCERFGDDYDEREIDLRWPTFNDNGRANRVTFRSVSAMVHTNERESLKKTLVDDEYRQRANEVTSYAIETINKSINFDLEVDTDTVQLMLKGSFWNANQAKINMTNNDDELVIFPETKASEMLIKRFGQPIKNMQDFTDHLQALELPATEVKRYKAFLMSNVISSIQFNSQGDSLTYCVDMFTERTYFKVNANNVVVNFKYKPLVLGGKHYRVECDECVQAYLSHFPECEDLLNVIVASRFASSRKKAYVWLKCPSDWGKDVFRNALGAFHFEMSVSEVEKALEGAPVGKSPRAMFRAFAMVTNEFKKVKSELKQLEDDITVAPKYQLETTVPLYTKLFMSAEGVDSLIGEYGVEDQFANRFSMIEGTGKLNQLPAFIKFGNTHFVNAVTTFITDMINNLVDEYRSLSPMDATSKGDIKVEEFHRTYGLKNTSRSIADSMKEIAEDIKEEILKRYQFDGGVEHNGIFYLKGAKTKIQDIIRNGDLFTVSERYTIAHKADEIIKILSQDGCGNKLRKVEGKTCRCLDISLVDGVPF